MPSYIGRFAPSPTGSLHLGSLLTALASYLDARAQGGLWLVRMEDIDPPREVPGASDQILRDLEHHGLHWDGEVLYQHTRLDAYADALNTLRARGLLYPCNCSRARLKPIGEIYPGFCRNRHPAPPPPCAWRLRVPDVTLTCEDAIQPAFTQHLARDVGDFVLLRKDGLYAYQLAVVVDDAFQQVTHVVRGLDLLDSTPRQMLLQQLLHFPTPRYAHLPLVMNEHGQKLSKQNLAQPLSADNAVHNLRRCLHWLRQETPPDTCDTPERVLAWAAAHWRLEAVQGVVVPG